MPALAFLGILAFIGAFVGLIAWAAKASFAQAKKRAHDLSEFGQSIGMRLVDSFAPHATAFHMHRLPINFTPVHEYPVIKMFRAYACRISNVLEGKDDRGRFMRSFDAQYTVSTGKSSTTYFFTIASIDTNAPVPDLAIETEGFWDKVKAAFGVTDLQIGNESFDKTFRVTCADEAFARSLIMAEMQDRLIANREFSTYISGGKVIVVKSYSVATTNEIGRMLDHADFIADRAVRPEPLSQVRYALHHSTPVNIDEVEQQVNDFPE